MNLKRLGIAVCLVIAALSIGPAAAVYFVRNADLYHLPTPLNPVKVMGRVTSLTPLRISDGRAEVQLTGVTARLGDLLVVVGDWNGSTLAVSQAPGKARMYTALTTTEMVYVSAGSYSMGNSGAGDDATAGLADEHPQHSVALSGFWIGKYTVTRGEYKKFMQAGGYSNSSYWSTDGWIYKQGLGRTHPDNWDDVQDWGTGPFTQTDSYPVIGISYYEAEAFCKWAGGRLPTEAEWEKAARWDGHPRIYPWGDTWNVAYCNSWDDLLYVGARTSPVGSYPVGVSPYGAYDMAGNMWQWCLDWYDPTYYSPAPPGGWSNPTGPGTGTEKVMRGCSYESHTTQNRSAARNHFEPYYSWPGSGFRMAE